MKKIIASILLLNSIVLIGCEKDNSFVIESQEVKTEQSKLSLFVDDGASKYKIRNLPIDKKYRLDIIYEVYKDNDKVTDISIFSTTYAPLENSDKNYNVEDSTLILNILKGNNIVINLNGTQSIYTAEDDLLSLASAYFKGNKEINIGDDIYLYCASNNVNMGNIESIIDDNNPNMSFEKNGTNIFIKLAFKEVQE